MTLAAHSQLVPEPIDANDRVQVPDGRVGVVIGFYCREDESVVVLFPCGNSAEFLTTAVERVS